MEKELVEMAKKAMEHAYAPYSGFKVGAAVMTRGGEVFLGCNVENASYPAGICAERVALSSAIASGHKEFSALAIISTGEDYCYPCGVCRQFMSEFEIEKIICAKNDGSFLSHAKEQLLPYAFVLKTVDSEQ